MRSEPSGGLLRRASLALSYLRLLARQRRAAVANAAPYEIVLRGQRLAAFDLDALRFSFEEIFVERVYDCSLPYSPTIVDCGANIGLVTAFFVTEYPGATVVAIEPDPIAFRLLARNIEQNAWTNVTAHNVAAGEADGSTHFFRDPEKPGSLVGSTTRRVLDQDVIDVEVRRVSALLPAKVDLLKLDTEGAEQMVVSELSEAGAISRVERMLVEFHHAPNRPRELAVFLETLAVADFRCEIRGVSVGAAPPGETAQDVLIFATRD